MVWLQVPVLRPAIPRVCFVRTTKERLDRRLRTTRFLPLRTTRFPHPPEFIETIRSNSAYSNSKRCKNRRGSFLHFAAAASRRISHKKPYANRPVILPGVVVLLWFAFDFGTGEF